MFTKMLKSFYVWSLGTLQSPSFRLPLSWLHTQHKTAINLSEITSKSRQRQTSPIQPEFHETAWLCMAQVENYDHACFLVVICDVTISSLSSKPFILLDTERVWYSPSRCLVHSKQNRETWLAPHIWFISANKAKKRLVLRLKMMPPAILEYLRLGIVYLTFMLSLICCFRNVLWYSLLKHSHL